MNAYFVIILAALIIIHLVEIAAEWLNLRALRPEVPADFRGVFDAEKYRKSQEYTRARTKFSLVSSTFHLAVLLVFWLAGGFNALDVWLRGFGWPPLVTGLAYIGVL